MALKRKVAFSHEWSSGGGGERWRRLHKDQIQKRPGIVLFHHILAFVHAMQGVALDVSHS